MGAPAARAPRKALIDVLLESFPVPAFVLRRDGSVHRCNALARDLLRVQREPELRELAMSATPSEVYEVREVHTEDDEPAMLVFIRPATGTARTHAAAARWGLSPRERQVLVLVASGLSNKQIAARERIAEVTVENHLTRVFRKAGVESRTALLASLLRD